MARGYTGRMGVVSARGGYHGVSGLPAQAGDEDYIVGPRDPNFSQAPFGDAQAFDRLIDETTAAVILETIPATGGFPIPPDDFFPRIRQICDDRGAVLIIDEVQTGLGRTGRLWAFEEWGIVPDVVVLGKGPSGAYYPMSVATWRKPLDRFFQERPFVHPSSFAGADLACVVFMAVLDEVTAPGFMEHVSEMGARMEEGLERIQRHDPGWLREVRGRGLLLGLEGPGAGAGFDLARACVERGVLAIGSFNRPSTMQCLPPLIIDADEVDEVLEVIGAAVASLAQL
jgi:acetylornithine/succinyldiaminopimelate/putrescine aminotransferase